MFLRLIDYTMFKYGSLFRPVDCGELEDDRLNIARFRNGIMKYSKKISDNREKYSKMDFTDLDKMKGKGFLYTLFTPATFVVTRSITRKFGYMTFLATIGVSILAF